MRKTINHKGKDYSYDDLIRLEDKLYEEHKKKYLAKLGNGFMADPRAELNINMSQEVEEYKLKMKASRWLSNQRKKRRDGKLSNQEIEKLNRLGMTWNPSTDEWKKNFIIYREDYICDEIEHWVKEQRSLFIEGKLSKENIIRLESTNFPFKATEDEKFPLTMRTVRKLIDSWYEKYPVEIQLDENHIQNLYNELFDKRKEFYDSLHYKSISDLKIIIDSIINKKSVYHEVINNHVQKLKQSGKYKEHLSSENKFWEEDTLIDTSQITQLKIFNNKRFDNHIRAYACELMLDFFECEYEMRQRRIKSFNPLNFLIKYYKEKRSLMYLKRLKVYIEEYPILQTLYSEKLSKAIKAAL